MTAAEFIAKWSDATLRERQGSQEHFLDLCRLLGQPTPAEDDPHGERYCFERGATKAGGGDGWADVWRRGCFGWEYKGPHKDLNAAYRQLTIYASNLESPPYLVVSDMARIVIHTNWTNTVSRVIELSLEDLREPAKLDLLRQVFEGSERLKPSVNPQEMTSLVAQQFGVLGRRLQERGHQPRDVAHFLNRLVFCMFAEDAQLLPKKLFTRLIRNTERRPEQAAMQLDQLFATMRTGGFFGVDTIHWFNGGLFDEASALPLEAIDLKLIGDTSDEHDWSEIDPAVFGTLFEEALKATRQRAALGAHYTDRAKILKIVDPVIVWPLTAEWETALAEIKAHGATVKAAEVERRAVMDAAGEAMKVDPAAARAGEAARRKKLTAIARKRDAAFGAAKNRLEAFLSRLAAYRVLDPACGSGNFLYVALHALKDLELRAIIDAERAAGVPPPAPRVGLDCVRGIEIEAYAAELARVTLWIGDLQWMRKNGYSAYAEPILSKLEQIENRDALLNPDGTEAAWPKVDVIIGNPPFLGDRKMIADIGKDYVATLRKTYRGRVPASADFVTYWVEKAWRSVSGKADRRVGLVTTNSIRGGASRKVLAPIADANAVWEAWADEPWVLDGAAVRVSMIGFGQGFLERRLDGLAVDDINADLTSSTTDIVRAGKLAENTDRAFQGTISYGPFEIDGAEARRLLDQPQNPNGRSNSDVVKPWTNGQDITRRPSDSWIVFFDNSHTLADASLYEAPFALVEERVRPYRASKPNAELNNYWWRLWRARAELFAATAKVSRQIVTARVAKYRLFVWRDTIVVPDSATVAIARDDDTTFGILHSHFHELWSLRMGTWLGVGNDPRYTPSTTFETFPFPEGLTPNIPAADYADDPRAVAIAEAAKALNELREAWLNPADLVRIEPEVVAGYPDRLLPVSEQAAKVLKTRTLTNLYNQRPAWLDMAHKHLDAAVAAAYGWPADLADDEVLDRLFALNQERAAAERPAPEKPARKKADA
ncbi:MAG: class I SAM-dependent DNA methyltransferase [Brevundimonas sp.]|nr:MAG: class I SAM-dependent DNA methyltransferase [Brevundimonas sp.]